MASSTSTMGKRVSAWLLVLVMLLSLLPTAALAADEEAPAQGTAEPADTAEPTEPAEPDGAELLEIITPGDAVPVNAPTGTGTSEDPFLVSSEEELRKAVSADPAEGTPNHIRLAANITLTDSVTIDMSACIDLSGYKITYTGTDWAFDIYAALEVTDSSDAQTGAITSTAAAGAAEDEIPLAFYMNNGSSLRYSGGATSNFIHCVTVGPNSYAAVSMSGGSMSARKDAVLLYGNGSRLSVGGGAVNGNIVVAGSGSDTNCQFCLSGGTVNGDVTLSMSQGANVTGSDNGITISAGTVNGNVTVGSRATGSLTISGGTVTGTVSKTASDAPATISVTGGTFPKCDVTAYLDADHVYNAETGAVTEYVAVYGDTRYADIDKALTAWAEGGGTLELLTDCTVDFTEGLSVEKDAALRLGGKTLTLSHGYIAASNALTIQNGKIVVPSDGSYYAVCGYYGSDITLTNAEIEGQKNGAVTCSGTLTMDGGKLTGSGYGLSASGSGTFTVKSGEINILKASNQAAVILGEDGGTYTDLRVNTLSLSSNSNSVEFKSGIVGTLQTYYSPALTATENAYFVNRFTKGLPAGKTLTEVEKDGSTYYQLADLTAENAAAKVTAADGTETFYDDASVAAAALKAGGTLTLLRDHTGDTLRVRPGSGSVTIDMNNCTVTNKSGPGLYVVINGNPDETAPYTITVKNGTLASADSVALRADSVNNAADVVTENVTLTPGADHSPVELQDSARLVFTDEATAAQQLGTGYAVTADGKNYAFGIIGGLSYAAKTLPAEGGVVKLLNDYTGSEKMTYTDSTGKNVTLDLNGKTYNCTYAEATAALEFNRPNSRLTVKNGKIISAGLYGVYAVASDYPTASANDLKLTLDGVTVSAPKGNGIGVNGVLTGNETVIRNSTVTSGDTGIYYPANGTLKIENTTVTGEKLGVALKGGTAEISGENTRITANAAEKEPTDYYDGGNTGSILAEGYAVYMEGGYNRGISLTISGGTFTSRGDALKKYVKDTDTGYSRTISVSGGTFSSPVKKEYCADGYTLTRQADGTYSVKETVYEASIGETKYETFAEAVAAVADGGTITLLQDVTVGSPVAVNGKSILLDLNGKTVTGINTDTNSVFTVYSGSGLTLMNGTVAASNSGGAITTRGTVMLQNVAVKGSAKDTALISVNTGAEVTVDANSSVVTMDGATYPAIILNKNEDGGVKTLNVYGKVAATGMPGVQGNGADQDTSYVNIYSGASVTSNKLAMYLPQKCIVNVNGTVSGYCGIGIKSGTLNISGGLVQGTANDNVIGNQYSTTNGINYDGSAILVDSYIGYAGNVTINITGGKVQSRYSTAIREIGNDASKTLMVSLNVSGGEVYGASGAEAIAVRSTTRKTVSVSGGTFSSPVEKEYCTEGYEPVTNTDGTYGVGQVYRPVEVWTAYDGEKVASYSTAAEAAAHLDGNQWIVIGANYTLEADFVIPQNVRLDVAKDATLTIPAGVKLTVAANAKRFGVRTGAAVENHGTILVCGTSYTSGYVLLQDGGTLDTDTLTVPDGYILDVNGTNYFAGEPVFEITYADGTTKKTGSQPTQTVLAGAEKLTLLKNLSGFAYSFTSVDGLAENFVFDLGGHTLSGGSYAHTQVLTVGVPMTIQNGTIEYTSYDTKYGAVKTLADVTFGSDLVVRGGKGYGVWTEGYGHTLTVNGTVQTEGGCAITGNGASDGGIVDECNIVVNDGAKIKAPNGIGIYHPQRGTVTVKGGEITGSTGVQLCAGKLSVSGGSITSTGDDSNASGSQNAMDDGAAISLVNRGYPGGTPSAEIRGGTAAATGSNALAVKAYDYSNNSVEEWTEAGDNIQISGGTFSNPVKEEYCAEGYEPKDNTDGTYTVARKQTPTPTPTLEPSATPTPEPSTTPTPTATPTPAPTQKPTPKPTSSTRYPVYTTSAPAVKKDTIPVTVKGTQFTVNGAAKQESFTGSYAKLTKVTVKYTGSEEFVCWVNGSGNVVTTEKSFRLTVVGKTELTAITCAKDRKDGETLLVYGNAAENGQLVHTETVTAASVTSDEFTFPAAVSMPGREFTYWTVEIGGERVEATADVLKAQIESGAKALILAPEYEAAGTYRVQLLCTDEAGTELQTPVVYTGMETGMLKYVTAPDISGYTFSCWKDETGRAVGTNRKYAAFSADADALVTLTAVYVPAGQTAAKNEICVTLSLTDAAKTDGAGTISFAAIFSVPDNRTVVKRGFLYTDNSRKTLTCENSEDLKTFEWDSETENCGRMVVTLGLKDTLCAVYVRAFAVLDDGTVVYSDMVSYSVDTAIDAAETAADAELPKDNAETVETEGDAFCDAGSVTTKW